MASREFLKILSSARTGDVSAQQKLAKAYLTGIFKTPIQPPNALIWLEKSYSSLKSQMFGQEKGVEIQITDVLRQIANIPLAQTFDTPGFGFGWGILWELSKSSSAPPEINLQAKWQLANLLSNPAHQELQNQIGAWLKKNNDFGDGVESSELGALQKTARQFLKDVAESNQPFAQLAKELLIKLQPKNEALSSLWNDWLENQNEAALIQAAELGLTSAKLTLGLRLAQLDGAAKNKSNASLKKAAYWLELAAKNGDRDAWYSLGEIYRRPQFSGYNAQESDRCFDRAADLGHPQAQYRKGANLWRKREKLQEKVRGLQASYWIWQANQQGIPEAKELLSKILASCSDPKQNNWYELAQFADRAISHHSEHKLDESWLMLCHRIVLANQFNFSKAELLLCEVGQLQHEHCVVVDIRWELPKILPRLIQIETIQQRRALLAAGKVFASSDLEIEGNLRQKRYRFDQVTDWLNATFGKSITKQIDSKITELGS